MRKWVGSAWGKAWSTQTEPDPAGFCEANPAWQNPFEKKEAPN
jgi:hypothetical protein